MRLTNFTDFNKLRSEVVPFLNGSERTATSFLIPSYTALLFLIFFQFSILQILPKTVTDDGVVAIESVYKKKLMSFKFGLNEN